jgi:hypothetical protein
VKTISLLIALVIALPFIAFSVPNDAPGGEEHPARHRVVAYAKRIDVHELDPKLASEQLEHYLFRVLPSTSRIAWASSDCETKPPALPRPPTTPLCASIRANVLGGGLHLEIVVGSDALPINGKPHVEKLYLLGKSSVHSFQSLSDFALALRRGV